jgi:hypothetical protein
LQQHFELYGVKGLDDVTHMLELNITDIEAPSSSSPPLAFYIDYFTYSTENSPLIQLTSANGVPVNAEFLRKMEVSDVPKAPAPVLGPQYIAAVVILVLSSIIMLWFGRKYLVIALAWLLTLGDKPEQPIDEEKGEKRERRRKRYAVRKFARNGEFLVSCYPYLAAQRLLPLPQYALTWNSPGTAPNAFYEVRYLISDPEHHQPHLFLTPLKLHQTRHPQHLQHLQHPQHLQRPPHLKSLHQYYFPLAVPVLAGRFPAFQIRLQFTLKIQPLRSTALRKRRRLGLRASYTPSGRIFRGLTLGLPPPWLVRARWGEIGCWEV